MHKLPRAFARLMATAAIGASQIAPAFAHTTSIGYENAGPGAVTFWFGTYHGSNFTEGSMQLVGPSTNSTVPFSLLVSTKPAGLIDGTTNFFSNGTHLTGDFSQSVRQQPINAWQGVTFSHLLPGQYTFTYIPIAFPTSDWRPTDSVILSNTVTLSAALIGALPLRPSAQNGNQNSVAGAIDGALAGGNTDLAFLTLTQLSDAEKQSALQQLAGEPGAKPSAAAFEATSHFLGVTLDMQYAGSRGGSAALERLRHAQKIDVASLDDAWFFPASSDKRYNLWGTMFGGHSTVTGQPSTVGTHDTSGSIYGVVAGLDYRLTRTAMIGLALGGGDSTWSLSQGLGEGENAYGQMAIYGAQRLGQAYLAASVGFGLHRVSTDRFVTISGGTDHLTAKFTSHSLGARFEGGYRLSSPNHGITPYAAVQYQRFDAPDYQEGAQSGTTTFALHYDKHDSANIRTELGTRADMAFDIGDAVLMLTGQAAWAHDMRSGLQSVAAFQTLPGSSFVINSAQAGKDAAVISLGTEYAMLSGVSINLKLNGDYARRSATNSGSLTVSYAW